MKLSPLVDDILSKVNTKDIFTISVDGRGGSGKSTLSKQLNSQLSNSKLIELDAFQIDSADIFNRENISRKFDIDFENRQFDMRKISEVIQRSNNKVFILEGCFSFKNLTGIKLDYLIWVDVDKVTAAERLNAREKAERTEIDPKIIELSTKKYQNAEDRYILDFEPRKKADFVFEG